MDNSDKRVQAILSNYAKKRKLPNFEAANGFVLHLNYVNRAQVININI